MNERPACAAPKSAPRRSRGERSEAGATGDEEYEVLMPRPDVHVPNVEEACRLPEVVRKLERLLMRNEDHGWPAILWWSILKHKHDPLVLHKLKVRVFLRGNVMIKSGRLVEKEHISPLVPQRHRCTVWTDDGDIAGAGTNHFPEHPLANVVGDDSREVVA